MTPTDAQRRAASISFRQLKLFESVGRLKSVRRASEECNLSQPAVTQALAKLEQQVGRTLIERRASGSYTNALGELFYGRIQRFFDQMEQALTELGIPGGHGAAKLTSKRLSRSQVRSLVAVIENGSFAQGAEALGLSQTSLQRAARDLEANLRKPIYYRTAAGFMVTPAGLDFGRKMKLALQEIEWGIREIEAAEGGYNTRIVIGAMPFGGSMLIASVLDAFLVAHPQADIAIVSENASEMQKRLRAGDVDFVIGLLPEHLTDDIVSEAFARTPYQIVARLGHPLLRKGRVSHDDLLSYDWVVGMAGASRRACFERLFDDGRRPHTPIATSAMAVVHDLLAGCDRLTLMTSYELMHQRQTLVPVPFGPIEPAPYIGITMRANWLPTPLHAAFIALVRERMQADVKPNHLRRVG
jgi:DNA-binding transcriptional LysR family regulator